LQIGVWGLGNNSSLALLGALSDTGRSPQVEDEERMRRFSRVVAGLTALCVVVLLGCPGDKKEVDAGVPDAGPRELTEKEPNERPEQALALTGSSVVSATLSADPSKLDEDWY